MMATFSSFLRSPQRQCNLQRQVRFLPASPEHAVGRRSSPTPCPVGVALFLPRSTAQSTFLCWKKKCWTMLYLRVRFAKMIEMLFKRHRSFMIFVMQLLSYARSPIHMGLKISTSKKRNEVADAMLNHLNEPDDWLLNNLLFSLTTTIGGMMFQFVFYSRSKRSDRMDSSNHRKALTFIRYVTLINALTFEQSGLMAASNHRRALTLARCVTLTNALTFGQTCRVHHLWGTSVYHIVRTQFPFNLS